MAMYEFECTEGCGVRQARAPMSAGPGTMTCVHGPMQRVYGSQARLIAYGDMGSYIDKAYRGEETPPGMTTAQVRAIVDTQMKTNKRGRENARVYKTAR